MATKENYLLIPINHLETRFSSFVKRVFDLTVSAVALLVLLPFFGLIGLAIRNDTPGPVFFRGRRMGQGGKVFQILKFRTMFELPASYTGPKVTAQDDPRITPLGRWLRDTKLNELPQFWNVFKGEMSLVGPRPEDPELARTWPATIRDEILSVRPGITSPASVQYHDEESLLSVQTVFQKYVDELSPDKLRLDQLYVHYRSFWLDLDTLFWTAMILIPKVGARVPPEELLLVGPISRVIRKFVNWFTIDMLTAFSGIVLAVFIWRMVAPLNIGWYTCLKIAVGFSFLFSVLSALMGVNRISWSKAAVKDIFDLFPAWICTSLIAIAVNATMERFPLGVVLLACFLSLTGFIFLRLRTRLILGFINRTHLFRSATIARERVLIVGSGRTAEQISWLLDHPAYAQKMRIVGFVDDDLRYQGMRIYGATIMGTFKDLPELIQKHDIGLVILADHRIDYSIYTNILELCKKQPARVIIIPDIFGSLGYLIHSIDPDQAFPEKAPEQISFVCQSCLTRFQSIDPADARVPTGGASFAQFL